MQISKPYQTFFVSALTVLCLGSHHLLSSCSEYEDSQLVNSRNNRKSELRTSELTLTSSEVTLDATQLLDNIDILEDFYSRLASAMENNINDCGRALDEVNLIAATYSLRYKEAEHAVTSTIPSLSPEANLGVVAYVTNGLEVTFTRFHEAKKRLFWVCDKYQHEQLQEYFRLLSHRNYND